MAVIRNEIFEKKAKEYKRPLKHWRMDPVRAVRFEESKNAFQKLSVVPSGDGKCPFILNAGEQIILDFGDHGVGYLHFALNHVEHFQITDSPVKLKFTFGEFPLEIVTKPEDYHGWLGNGWLQNEIRTVIYTPYAGTLERRYAFRYLKIERVDNARFPITMEEIYADCVSAVEMDEAPAVKIQDPVLAKIYEMSLKTLRECEQDVFEDGPKRDRRMWIGDLRLQALTDSVTFQNQDLVKRCIYLFAAYRTKGGFVAPYVFPDSPPYVDDWVFIDYSMFFVSCLYDYVRCYEDRELLEELYPVAKEQIRLVSGMLDRKNGKIPEKTFIDWCPDLDMEAAILGVYLYVLNHFHALAEMMKEDTAWIDQEKGEVKELLLRFFDSKIGMFVTSAGQISWHSQIWAVLSGAVDGDAARNLLRITREKNPRFIPHTPYMMHCYLEALDMCGMQEELLEQIREFWGKIAEAGFDCCPEVFNPEDPFESPYDAPEINSACHAWSCTPAYWIRRYGEMENS